MGNIKKMSTQLANMIAAGEVVERPSSVVKELVENAIDAKATTIKVFLEDGGLKEIKVVDDGIGMDEEDVRLAFFPHATSKIKTEYDLFRILSLGFRGEAIASIAAVSHMQIISSLDGIKGYQVTYQSGNKIEEGICHANKGTTVIVKNLFFNTPARLKYLKPAKNELAAVSFFMDKIALAHPNIRFMLINDNKTILSTSASNQSENLMGEIYNLEVAKNLLKSNFIIDGVKSELLLVKPEIYRANKLEITLIVNGRYVKNYNITNSVIEGYKTYLPIGKYPIAVIYLDIDPILVDVNVHPSKTEIKISSENILLEQIEKTIAETLKNSLLIPTRNIARTYNTDEGYQKINIFEVPTPVFHEEKKDNNAHEVTSKEIKPNDMLVSKNPILSEPKEESYKNVNKLPYMEYIGQAFGTYLIFQNSEGLYLIDQHAAAERINYEKNYEILGKPQQPTTDLLLPILISFTKSESLFLEEHLKDFQNLGFNLEPIANQDYVVRSMPLWAKIEKAEELIHDIFSLMIQERKIDIITFRDSIAKQISCKSSIKANHALNRIEVDALIDNLKECKNPYTCPHGRPTLIKLSEKELEKMFERIQS
ncbi:MAG: DNA mismatch repair endonuclease MutL [Anaeroplasmataceae bacterium]|nr:DNA mismatch repair endonuclease MutL [Anaeroplasmataceae bacterium]